MSFELGIIDTVLLSGECLPSISTAASSFVWDQIKGMTDVRPIAAVINFAEGEFAVSGVFELDGSGQGGGEGNGDVSKHGGCCGCAVAVICFLGVSW